nr:hypothetical protein [Entomoplasma sp. MP1]
MLKALDGASGTFASTLVANMINAFFFNADLSVTEKFQRNMTISLLEQVKRVFMLMVNLEQQV